MAQTGIGQHFKESFRDTIEEGTGFIGQTLRRKRQAEEKKAKTEKAVAEVEQVTSVFKNTNLTLSRLETSFLQISKNVQLLAKSMDAMVTLQEETNASMGKATRPVAQVQAEQKQAKVVEKITNDPEEKSLFGSAIDLLEDIGRKTKTGGKPSGRERTKNARTKAEEAAKKRGAPKEEVKKAGQKAAEKATQREAAKKVEQKAAQQVARKAALQAAGRGLGVAAQVAGKVAAPIGLAMGAYEASEYLKESKYGERMAAGEGKLAEKAFKNKNTDFSHVELTAQQAKDILDSNSKRDIESFGGRERLEAIAGIKKAAPPPPPPINVTKPLPATGAGAGRGGRGGPTAEEILKSRLTPSQLAWLGGADVTDAVIMSRMPPPQPGEKGGPTLLTPLPPVAPTPAPVAPTPAPVSKPPVPSTPTPSGAAEPLVKKISAQSGRQAMIDEMDKQGITDPVKRAAIMAQAAVETGGFQFLSENLAYNAGRMKEVFGRLKNTPIETIQQAIQQGVKGIGTLVYGGDPSSPSYQFGVKQLGNVQPGDGFKYRGRGFFQLTGRSNYTKAGVADQPEKLLDLKPAAETAVNFANRYKGSYDDVNSFTRFVNGGLTHVKERGEFFAKFLNDPSIIKANTTLGNEIGNASTTVAAAKKGASSAPNVNINNYNIQTAQSPQGAQRPRGETASVVGV